MHDVMKLLLITETSELSCKFDVVVCCAVGRACLAASRLVLDPGFSEQVIVSAHCRESER